MSTNHNIKIKFKSFNSGVLDKTVVSIVNTVTRVGGSVCGPVPLPKKIEKFTIIRSPHIHKKSMDQFVKIKYCRLLIIFDASPMIIEELSKIEVASGVGVEISIIKQ